MPSCFRREASNNVWRSRSATRRNHPIFRGKLGKLVTGQQPPASATPRAGSRRLVEKGLSAREDPSCEKLLRAKLRKDWACMWIAASTVFCHPPLDMAWSTFLTTGVDAGRWQELWVGLPTCWTVCTVDIPTANSSKSHSFIVHKRSVLCHARPGASPVERSGEGSWIFPARPHRTRASPCAKCKRLGFVNNTRMY